MVKCLQICLSNMLFWDIWNTSQIFEHAFMNFQKQIYFVSTCMKYVYMQKKPRPLWIKFASTCPLLISRILASSTPSEGLSFHFWPLLVSSLSLFHFWPLPWCHHFHLSTFGHSPGVITFTFFLTFTSFTFGVITFTCPLLLFTFTFTFTFTFSFLATPLVSSLSLVHCALPRENISHTSWRGEYWQCSPPRSDCEWDWAYLIFLFVLQILKQGNCMQKRAQIYNNIGVSGF